MSQRWFGLVAVAAAGWVGVDYWRVGHLANVLWTCNVCALLQGIGLLWRRPALVKLATVWLWVGLPVWLLDALQSGDWHAHSWATHLALPLLGLWSLRQNPTTARVWPAAIALGVALKVVCRLATPAADNVNLAFRAWDTGSGLDPNLARLWLGHVAATGVGLWLAERVIDGVVRWRRAEG